MAIFMPPTKRGLSEHDLRVIHKACVTQDQFLDEVNLPEVLLTETVVAVR